MPKSILLLFINSHFNAGGNHRHRQAYGKEYVYETVKLSDQIYWFLFT